MVWCLMFCLVSYSLISDVLPGILLFGVSCLSYLMVWCLLFCLVSYGLVADVLSRILWLSV